MDKNYRQYNKRASMDSIEVPDVDKIKKLSDKKFKGSGVNRTADEIFDGEKFNKAGEQYLCSDILLLLQNVRSHLPPPCFPALDS